ncbi:RNA polymerase sigma factor [Colwellia hornerae]|uniref:RNA polymerase sigma factor n=1 Tax=Colwellia hornerae TaxID=89402 RepID=A0A5C6QPD3_9GAMM|nr:RNA polymerase sigma factor [Colwellia hornerae]TWX56247.1 RNA polymerase sigma factor [Colwellia hornerae]TWX62098.1 RNA polymerase sigma factor [Colwellia hornerae]TWX70500.1 RNA polymerase sigma factor [Colwellia hornerae]
MIFHDEQQLLPDVVLAKTGDQLAFARLIEQLTTTVAAISLAITKDLDSSEDVSQKVFIKVWREIKQLKENISFLPWVRQVTRYTALNHLRDEKVTRNIKGDQSDLLLATLVDPSHSADVSLLREEQNILIQTLLAELPDESREIVLLYYREQQSSQSVALLLGLNEATVRKRLSRVRALIKEQVLARYGNIILSTSPLGLTALVLSGLSVSSPVAAAVVTKSIVSSQSHWFAKILFTLGGAMLGAVLGMVASYIGMSKVIEKSVDEKQKQQLVILRNKTACYLLLSGILLTLSYELTFGWLMPLLCFIALFFVIYRSTQQVNKLLYLDIDSAVLIDQPLIQQNKKDKFWCQFGLISGFLGGGSGLVLGLYNSGRFATFF